MMRFSTANEWLKWIGSVHSREIDLGLDRVKRVAEKLRLLNPSCKVITVAGTNGKGSTVAGLEAIYIQAGYQVGAFTSPMLFKMNEQIRVSGRQVSDDELCQAFGKIDQARGGISLSPFEFHTLAALVIFQQFPLDVMILEVGLGGRLDAVNIIDADVAVITSIGIDHVEWLGDTREKIGIEKAGIFKAGKLAVCGDIDPPHTIAEVAHQLKIPIYFQGKDFHYVEEQETWVWHYQDVHYEKLPLGALLLQNMATVLMAIQLLPLKVSRKHIDAALTTVSLPGRIQIIQDPILTILDVSHNTAAIAQLVTRLQQLPCEGKTLAVFSMLHDKDILSSINTIKVLIDEWYVAPLQNKRAASQEVLEKIFAEANINCITHAASIAEAYQAAINNAKSNDRLVIFGSFRTVAETVTYLTHMTARLIP